MPDASPRLCLPARHARKHGLSGPFIRLIPDAFVMAMLLASQALGYIIAHATGRMPTGYGMAMLAAASFFAFPPRRLLVIVGISYLVFFSWVGLTDFSFYDRAAMLLNNGVVVIAAIAVGWTLDRIRRIDREQQAKILQQYEALQSVNAQLAYRNAELKELMAIAAHDLRSPLLGVSNLIDLARSRSGISVTALQDVLGEAGSSVSTMLELIDRLLQTHRAETQAPPARECCDLGVELASACREAAGFAGAASITLLMEASTDPVRGSVEREALQQILGNLLSNAIRFSPAGSTVRLRCGGDDPVWIAVEDAGIGICEEQQERLFTKFGRGDGRALHGPRGSGLGLYIAQTLAQGMGGRVTYAPAEGAGSVFTVELLACRPERVAEWDRGSATIGMDERRAEKV